MSDWQGSGFKQPMGGGTGGFDGEFGGQTDNGASYGGSGFAGLDNGVYGSHGDYSRGSFGRTSQGLAGSDPQFVGAQVGKDGNLAFTSAPYLMLLPSLISGLFSIVICLVLILGNLTVSNGMYFPLALGAWAMAGIVGVVGLGPYFAADNAQRTAGIYQIVGWKQGLYWVTIIAVLVGVVLSAIQLGIWAGKS